MRLKRLTTLRHRQHKSFVDSCSEHNIQKALFEWLDYYPHVRGVSFAVENGGSRHIVEAKNLKSRGVTAGIPDVFILIPRDVYYGLLIELKKKDGVVKAHQHIIHERLRKNGYKVEVCYSLDEAIVCIEQYLGVYLNARQQSV